MGFPRSNFSTLACVLASLWCLTAYAAEQDPAQRLLNEQRELTPRFYAGVAMILIAVFAHPLTMRRKAAMPMACDSGKRRYTTRLNSALPTR